MRKLLTIMGLFVCFFASAQLDTTKLTPNNNASIQYGAVRAIKGFGIPVFGKWSSDTSSKIPGLISLIGNTVYFAGSDGHYKTVPTGNIYTENNTLTGDRTVTANQKKFYVTGAKQIYLKANDTGQVVQSILSISKDEGITMAVTNFPKAAGFMLPQEGGYAQVFGGNNTLEVNEDSVIVNGKNIARSVNGNLANPAGDISIDLSNYIQKQTQSPTATLTGGETRELMGSGANLTYTLSWSAGRMIATSTTLATGNIVDISINGVSQTFSNPSAGSTVSGTYTATVVRNTNTPFTNTVTTADSKTATASTTVYFSNDKYWFYSDAATPTSGEITAHAGGNIDLLATETRAKSNFGIVVSGTKYIHYMYPARIGSLTSIKAGNVESIAAFTKNTVSVTNSAGYTENYYDYVNNATFTNTTFTFDTVQ